jgi:hypothetical protein
MNPAVRLMNGISGHNMKWLFISTVEPGGMFSRGG